MDLVVRFLYKCFTTFLALWGFHVVGFGVQSPVHNTVIFKKFLTNLRKIPSFVSFGVKK